MFSVSSCSAPGDPHLGSEQPIGAVVLRLGTGQDVGQRRARLGLRQRHRAGEPARQHRLEEGLDLILRAELGQQVGVGHGQHEVARRADVGRGEPGECGFCHGGRQLRAPEALVHRHAHQVGLGEGVPSLLDLTDDGDRFSVETRLVRVALLVVRREVPGRPTARTDRGRRRRFRGSVRRTAPVSSARRCEAIHRAESRDRAATAEWTSPLHLRRDCRQIARSAQFGSERWSLTSFTPAGPAQIE